MNSKLFDLKDHVIVITGAAGLLGAQHADAVASMGGIPVLLDLHTQRLDELAGELKLKYEIESPSYVVDITNEAEISANCQMLLDRFGKIDALINNAANNPKMEATDNKNFSRLENFPQEIWTADVAVGLTGAFLCAKHYGTAISRNANGGVIVNIASDLGLIAPDQRLYRKPGVSDDLQPVKPVTYSVVKAGLIGLTRYLATYWPENVRCNAICPGGIEAGQPQDFLDEVAIRIPLGRLARADEYQGILTFLLSKASSYMNGAILPVDGGRSVW